MTDLKTRFFIITFVLFQFVTISAHANNHSIGEKSEHVELGNVHWHRKLEKAQKLSLKTGKPIFALFQEVPGCSGCQKYGEDVLSNAQIVEAIEGSFIPLAIHNNRGGYDRKILEQFNEPAWNFQVVRFLDENGNDLIPREDGVWSLRETAKRMIRVLKTTKQPIPSGLLNIASETKISTLKTAAFSMFCFWEGEAVLGRIHGVNSTEAGWIDGSEVVKIEYDPAQIDWNTLVLKAKRSQCAKKIFEPYFEKDVDAGLERNVHNPRFTEHTYQAAQNSDQKRSLQRTKFSELKLNKIQATKINAALRINDMVTALNYLSPSQIEKLKR